MFETSDKLILGYVRNGRWAEGSHQVVVFKTKPQFRVQFIQKLRSGVCQTVGWTYDEKGFLESGYFKGDKLIERKNFENVANNFIVGLGLGGKY